jgi:predicted nucleic acid-binding protein
LVCLDTDIIVGLLRGDERAVTLISQLQVLGETMKTTVITAYELLKGAAISSRPQENLTVVRDIISSLTILTLNYGVCEVASQIYSELKGRGQVISEFDILIAAISIYNDETLISRDKHFEKIENLRHRTW